MQYLGYRLRRFIFTEDEMSLEIIRNDITKVSADAIVNTANPEVAIGDGVDRAIYHAAGKEALLEARRQIGAIRPGDAASTPAFGLDAKYIIHTVGPVWQGGDAGEKEILADCYRKSLSIAKDLQCESVAFPLMAAGTYGFPKDAALQIAVSEISGFLFDNEMTVYLVVYNKEAFEISSKAFDDIKSYIDENEVIERESRAMNSRREQAGLSNSSVRSIRDTVIGAARKLIKPEADEEALWEPEEFESDEIPPYETEGSPVLADMAALPEDDLEEQIKHRAPTFQEELFRIIDKKDMDDVDVYKRANIDRKHFSKIKSNPDYNPTKKTAVAFAIALGLNLDETRDLLLTAGIALTRSNTFDIIISYCIEHNITDINQINCLLFDFDQPTLGV